MFNKIRGNDIYVYFCFIKHIEIKTVIIVLYI